MEQQLLHALPAGQTFIQNVTQGSNTVRKKVAITSRLDEEDLVLDNATTLLNEYHIDYAFFGFDMQLALAIKRIVAYQLGNAWRPALGPNLLIELLQGTPLTVSAKRMYGGEPAHNGDGTSPVY